MNEVDQQLLDRVLRVLPHYHATPTRLAWFDLPNVRNARLDYFIDNFVLPLLLVAVAYLLLPILPPHPVALSVNLSGFLIAVAISGNLSGRQGALIAAAASQLLIAWLVPPDGSLAIETAALPWFAVACVTFAVIAMISPNRGSPPSLTRRKFLQKTPHKSVKQFKRRFVIGDRMTIPLAR